MGATVRWAAWWLLAVAALGACIWLARYDVTASSGRGVVAVTLDRWTGSEEACSPTGCVALDRVLAQPDTPAKALSDANASSIDFNDPAQLDTALNAATAKIEADRQTYYAALAGIAAVILLAIALAVRAAWRAARRRLTP